MPLRKIALACCTLALVTASFSISAGTGYEVTSKKGEQTVTYRVNFGGGMRFEQYTAYDPVSDQFVYLTYKRGEAAPKPAGEIWDHRTGRTIKLYKFPKVEHPLPVIPSIDAMQVCPKTGDREYTAKAIIAYD